MALNAGEVEVTLRLRDQLNEGLKVAGVQAKTQIQGVSTTVAGMGDVVNNSGQKISTSVTKASGDFEKLYGQTKISAKEMQAHIGPTDNLTNSFKNYDSALQATGISIGPEIKAIGEFGGASGKAALQLGLVTTAGLALGAGMTGWKIARAAMEFFDLDKKVEGVWTRLLGLNDVISETAGAKMDTLAKASANAGREVTSLTEAIEINAKAAQAASDKKIDWAMKLSAAQREVRNLSAEVIAQIEVAQKAGASVEQLTNKYGISADGLRELANRQKLHGEAQAKATKEAEAHAAALAKLDADYAKLMSSVKNANQLAIMEADAQKIAAEALFKKNQAFIGWRDQQIALTKVKQDAIAWEKAFIAEQAALDAETKALTDTFAGAANVIGGAFGDALDSAGQKIKTTSLSFSEAMDLARQGKGTMSATVGQAKSDAQWRKEAAEAGGRVMGDSYGNKYVHVPGVNMPGSFLPGFANGGPTKEGPAYVHDGEYVVPKNGALVMAGSSGLDGGKVMQVQLVLADGTELARAVVPWIPGELRRIGVA